MSQATPVQNAIADAITAATTMHSVIKRLATSWSMLEREDLARAPKHLAPL
jgi:hypothetical protein